MNQESIKNIRQEFQFPQFRNKMIKHLGVTCASCGETKEIEYHHIVPIVNGGKNNLSNIVPLCHVCHQKAHDKNYKYKYVENKGRNKIIKYEDAEPILKRYFDIKIGTKQCKEELGISFKNKSTWYKLKNEYKKKHGIKNFYNNIDLKESKANYIFSNKNRFLEASDTNVSTDE